MGISKVAREEARSLHAEGLKRCARCSLAKPLNSFGARRATWDQLHPYCKECVSSLAVGTLAGYRNRWATDDPYADPSVKPCGRCSRELPRTDFTTNPSNADGLGRDCFECAAAAQSGQRERRRSQWSTPGADPYADPSLKRCEGCQQDRPRSDFYIHRSSADGLQRTCRNCDAARKSARRARLRGQFVEHVDRDVLWKRDQGICYLCNLPADPNRWDLEHIHPIVHGGEHSYANTAVSHPSCNNSKGGTPWPDVAFDPNA